MKLKYLIPLIAFIVLIVLFVLQIQYIITDEMHLSLEPGTLKKNVENNEEVKINFTLDLKKKVGCEYTCDYELFDVSNNKTIEKGISEKKNYSFKLSQDQKYSGKNIYNFNIACNHINSNLCRTSEKKYYQTSVIIINHSVDKKQYELQKRRATECLDSIDEYNYNLSKAKKIAELYNEKILLSPLNTSHCLNEWLNHEYNFKTIKAFNIDKYNNRLEKYNENVEILNSLAQQNFTELERFSDTTLLRERLKTAEPQQIDSLLKINETLKYEEKKKLFQERIYDKTSHAYLLDLSPLQNCSGLTAVQNKTRQHNQNAQENLEKTNTTINKKLDSYQNITINNKTKEIFVFNYTVIEVPKFKECTSEKINFTKHFSKKIITIEEENTSLPKNQPLCCSYNDCSLCNTSKTPVIFVHGHAISKQNRPEMSHEAFAVMQEKLQNQSYINGGHFNLNANLSYYGFNNPFTFRVSYYQNQYYGVGGYEIVTQKTENIETYAIRLKELIDDVTHRTGSDKVNIVAHSMGGLVSRSYLNIFGEEKVEKLIMLGTPNHGITGRVKTLCSVTGASKECRDMSKGSIFITNLNKHTPQIPIYTVSAVGCEMNGETGDGIVTNNSVHLPYATQYQIQGNCTDRLKSNLHTEFIKPNYPETFQLIQELLK